MTWQEVHDDIIASEHKRVSLKDINGKEIVPFNNTKHKIDVRLKEIAARVNSSVTPDGVYQVHAKHYGSRAVAAIYYLCKGDQEEGLADIQVTTHEEVEQMITGHEPKAFTQAEYNDLYRRHMHQEFEIERLEMKIDQLEQDLDILDTDPRSGGLLSDSNKEFFGTIMDNVIPLTEELLKQRGDKIQLQALEIAGKYGQAGQQPLNADNLNLNPQNNEPENPDLNEDAPAMHTVLADDEQQLEDEAHMYTMETLKAQNPEAYADIMNQMAERQTEA